MALEGLQLGNYRLVRLIGSGGMGEVYQAEDMRIQRQVAIKIIRNEVAPYPDADATKEAARLFQREMRAITTLDHAHILPLFDFGEENINRTIFTYMVMPLRQEGSLADWLQDRGSTDRLSPEDVSHIVNQAADALQHAHDHQLIHQDVKPSNFLIRRRAGNPQRPDLLLADFGIAKFTTATATVSQSIRGTPAYMAPEQWDGQPVAATDQYALAIMAYQLLTGRPPFQGGPGQVMRQHYMSQPQPPSTLNSRITPALDTVILKALEKKPEDRFASISAFAQAFQQAVQSPAAAGIPKPSDRPNMANTPSTPVPHPATQGHDLRATLAISEAEARTGTYRTLTLPGGRKVTVMVPASVQSAHTLRLEGQGEVGTDGLRGALIITVEVARDELRPPISTPLMSDAKTSRSGAHLAETPTVEPPFPGTIPATPRPSSPNIGQVSNLTLSTKRAGIVSRVGSLSRGTKVVLIGLVVLVVLGSVGISYFTNIHSHKTLAQIANPYPPNSGTLVLNDPLQDNGSNSYPWYEGSDATGACTFTGGAYHASVPQQGHGRWCSPDPSFSNFIYEIQMTVIQGDGGGIIFRADTANSRFYDFLINQNGSYVLYLYKDSISSDVVTLTNGSSSSIVTGLNQPNLIAIAANGSTITLYVNHQQIAQVSDSTYSQGQIGVFAEDEGQQTEVVFSNAKVWAL